MLSMSLQEYDKALRNPAVFVRNYIAKAEFTRAYVSKRAKVPYNTVKCFMNGTRPKTQVETLTRLIKFVLWHKKLKARGKWLEQDK